MFSRVLKTLYRSGWEFLLPLPLIAIVFWFLGNTVTQHVLSRPHRLVNKLHTSPQVEINLPVTMLAMSAEIDRQRGITTVFVRSNDPIASRGKYVLPVLETAQIEAAIARELDIPVETVRRLISYRIKN
jgi:hypothetical protein